MDRILLDGVRYGRHIFNLGHGVFPEADPQKLHWLTRIMCMNVVVNYGHKRGKLVNIEKKGLLFLSHGSPSSKDDLSFPR